MFNVGNPAEVTIRELAERIRDIVGSDSPIAFTARRPGDPERRRPDIGKIRARYGWEPRVGLAEGLAETIDTFRDGVPSVA